MSNKPCLGYGVIYLLPRNVRRGMGQSITSEDMTLEEKLKAIAEAIKALDGGINELICEGCN